MVNPSQNTIDFSQTENVGLIETIKNSVQPETVANQFGIDKHLLLDVGIYGTIGFIAGFLLKKYSEYFIAFILLLIGIFILQQFNYISVSFNSTKIHEILGFNEIPISHDMYGNLLWEWMRSHVASSLSLIVGFLIGLKVG